MALQWMCMIYFIYMFEAVSSKENIWYSYQFGSGHGNREELVISKVEAVRNFKTEKVVISWRTLSLKHKSYALGLTENGVIALQAVLDGNGSGNIITNSSHIDVNGTVIDASLFEHWNNSIYTNDIIAVIAIQNKTNNDVQLQWYKFTNNNDLIQIWNIEWKKNISHLNIFKIDNRWHILVCNDRYENSTTADLYEFSLQTNPDYWLTQKIHLITPTKSSAVSNYGLDTYLSIPQSDRILVYRYDTNHFMPQWNLTARNVHYVTAFKIGFQAFIAIDGLDAGIYKISDSGFVMQDIQDANLNGIDYWLSIPVRNYRDEEILIAERSLDHDSHRSFAIEVVLYKGGKFMVHDEMECHFYGSIFHGMDCFVEEENSVGLKGSAYLSVGDVLGVLVPRNRTTSRLFALHTQMREIESPLQKQIKLLNSFKERLQKKIEEQKTKIENLENSLKHSIKANEENIISEPWSVDTLATPALQQTSDAVFKIPDHSNLEKLFDRVADIRNSIINLNTKRQQIKPINTRGQFKHLIVNGPVEVHGASKIETLESENFNDRFDFNDYVRLDEARRISGQKIFSNIVVDSLSFETVNGINKDQLLFEHNDPIEVYGDIIFDKDVTVHGDVATTNINDMGLVEDLVSVRNIYEDTISFDNLTARGSLDVQTANKFPIHDNYLEAIDKKHEGANIENDELESLFIPGNVTVETINGENLNDLIFSLSLRDIQSYIPNETKILGDVHVINSEVGELNALEFSSGYVFTDADNFSRITGNKIFTNEIRAKVLTTPGGINGINTNNIITLSENQTIFGKFTFDQLRVIGEFNVSGNLNFGVDTTSINPTLLESSVISANCNFKNLEVDGVITVGSYNDINLEKLLSDVVYKTEPVAEITSIKDFRKGLTVKKNLNVKSDSINNEPINNFIDKEREQTMEIKTLNGNVTFENLFLLGNFGEVNISKLSQETVRISGEQFITANLIFESEVTVNDLKISKSLNDIKIEDFLFTDGTKVLKDVDFESVEVQNLIIKGNLNSTKHDFDIDAFDGRRLSLTKDQIVTGTVHLQNSKIETLKPVLINNVSFSGMFDVDVYGEKVKEMLESGKVKIKEMLVEDSLNISKVSNVSINEILKNCVWTEDKEFRTSLVLKDNVEFNSIEFDLLNGVDFSEIMKNLIYKNETDVLITGPKIFFNGYEVLNYISTPLLNEIRVENILRKGGEQSINSELWIDGDVLINNDFELQETLNNINLDDITTLFSVVNNDTYKILGHVDFTRMSHINELILESNINQENANEFFNSIVNIKDDTNITKDIRFQKPVTIAANLATNQGINGIDITNIKENIVFLTQDVSIEGVVMFKEDVFLSELIEVENELSSPLVMNCNLQNWIDDSVFVNFGKIPGTLHFDNSIVENNIITNLINQVDVKSLIPLRTDQTIPKDVYFGELSSFKDIVVNDFVNGHKLADELYNSVLSGRIQEITSNVIIEGSVLVHSHLDILGSINGHDISKMVTLDTTQNLNATYKFTNRTTIAGNVIVHGDINGNNITQWINNNVKKYSSIQQTITKPWTLENSLTFGNNVIGNGTISSLDLRIVADQVEERRLFKNHVELQLIDQFKTICNDINGIVAASKKQIFLFEYLEHHQIFDIEYEISNVHHIKFQDFNYMLVSDDTSCHSELFVWNGTRFSPVRQIETGKITQMITVRDGDFVFLVSRHGAERTSCDIEGVHVWKFSLDNFTPLYIMDDCMYLQESMVPGSFYTMDASGVSEYKLLTAADTNVFKVRRWDLDTANAAFVPRGINLGLALRNGKQVMKLSRVDQISQDDLGFNYNTVIVGNVTWEENYYLPGRDDGEMVIMNVGYPRRKTLIAVSSKEKTNVKGEFDVIKVFDNIRSGSLYHKIPASEPSSLLSMEFGDNGETLLIFLEGQERLKIFEYKGIEGYKQRLSVTIQGSKLVQMILPYGENRKPRNFIGVINKTRLNLLQAVMEGDQMIDENLQCNL